MAIDAFAASRAWSPILIVLAVGLVAACGERRDEAFDLSDVPPPPTRTERPTRPPGGDPSGHDERRSDPTRIPGFGQLARGLDGEIGATIGAPGRAAPAVGGDLTTGSAWSTIKVPIAARVLQDAGGSDRLTSTQRAQIARALTASDNAAAAELFEALGARHGGVSGAARAVDEVLREAGDGSTRVSTRGRNGFSPYGQTEWSLAAQHRFVAALAGTCVGAPSSSRYLLGLMGRVTSDRWGLGSAGVPARWKGGWGPGTDGRYLVRQMGVLDVDGKQVVVTLAARPTDGSFESGQAMASRVARWLGRRARGLDDDVRRC